MARILILTRRNSQLYRSLAFAPNAFPAPSRPQVHPTHATCMKELPSHHFCHLLQPRRFRVTWSCLSRPPQPRSTCRCKCRPASDSPAPPRPPSLPAPGLVRTGATAGGQRTRRKPSVCARSGITATNAKTVRAVRSFMLIGAPVFRLPSSPHHGLCHLVCVCVCVRACVRACVCACVRACVRVCVCGGR